jgi:hypothetical protein
MRSASELAWGDGRIIATGGDGVCALARVSPNGGNPANTAIPNNSHTLTCLERIVQSPVLQIKIEADTGRPTLRPTNSGVSARQDNVKCYLAYSTQAGHKQAVKFPAHVEAKRCCRPNKLGDDRTVCPEQQPGYGQPFPLPLHRTQQTGNLFPAVLNCFPGVGN